MKKLYIVTGFESTGSVFTAKVCSFVLNKCKTFGDWDGYGWNGELGEPLILLHRSMPYCRNPKLWLDDLNNELKDFNEYQIKCIICTRDLNISRISRISRFGGTQQDYLRDDEKARTCLKKLSEKYETFIFSLESAIALKLMYYQNMYQFLGVNSSYTPKIIDVNRPYVKNSKSLVFIKNLKKLLKRK